MEHLAMRLLPLSPTVAAISLLATLTGVTSATSLGKPGTGLYLLTDDNRLATVCETLPDQSSPPIPLTGLLAGDEIVSIDVRPLNQELYGLGRNPDTGTVQLYHLIPATGLAVPVGNPGTLLDDFSDPVPEDADRVGIDFSPQTDRLRVVDSNGLNFRMNPNNGALVIRDGDINGPTTALDEAAYTNNGPASSLNTLYTIDSSTASIYIQSQQTNAGTQSGKLPITISGSNPGITAISGFDIPPDVNAPSSDAAVASGSAYAAMTVGGNTGLYRIDLTSGAATLLGVPGYGIRGLAVRTQIPIAFALRASGSTLYRFRTDTATSISANSISGVALGETLVGIALRPATGQLYGLGIQPTANTGTLYVIDLGLGLCTPVGATGQIAFVDNAGQAVDLPGAGTGYGFDFNPMVDRARVVTGSGLNFRINPVTGAAVDGDTGTAGVNPDAGLNGESTDATAVAYTNSFAGTTATTLYTLDPDANALRIQNPANNGTQTSGVPLILNGAALDFSPTTGFDILTNPGVHPAAFDPAAAYAQAALAVGGTTSLYWINLNTGAATLQSQIGSGIALSSLVVGGVSGSGYAPMSWTSSSATVYRIETSTDLIHWFSQPGTVTASGSTTTVSVPNYPGETQRFWRAATP
jgi:hypothetical protein